ncbi:MAG: aminodeoxychorismate lyase, protein [Parcubacteria group bacterium]|nr:aminodeoxychorismate lyase, protein [Parcubacteria group bacterium]
MNSAIDISRFKAVHYAAAFGLFFLFFFVAVSAPPKNFPAHGIVTIREGAGLLEVSRSLQDAGVIRNASWFRTVAVALGGEKNLQSGDYYMPYPQSVYAIAERIVRGDRQIERFKVTIPEGFTAKKISNLFDARFALFDHREFLSLAPEGYLFPDTYFIGLNASATSTIALLKDNFQKRIFPLTGEIAASGRSQKDIITMASIIEKEANTKADKYIVSGILWKRIKEDLPLQVDATLTYIDGKESKDMTQADLKFDSPYNTYVYKGLPPTPISNPGLESIDASIHPTTTPYYYFLTGKDGKMYYAKTFDEHQTNIQKHL